MQFCLNYTLLELWPLPPEAKNNALFSAVDPWPLKIRLFLVTFSWLPKITLFLAGLPKTSKNNSGRLRVGQFPVVSD
jgi:hypothetical protein